MNKKKKEYSEHVGCITDGPSREALDDSLRLGKIFQVQFVFSDREIRLLWVVVTCMKKNNPKTIFSECNDWYVELLISGKYQVKNPQKEIKYPWKGNYSSRKREGEMTGDLPSCLIVKDLFSKKAIIEKFVVGKFFNEDFLRDKLFPNGFSINQLFIEKLVEPNKNKVIKINENIGKLKICNLPETLNDTKTQNYAESATLAEDELFKILYLLICDYICRNTNEPRICLEILGTAYYSDTTHNFHVKLSSGELLHVSLSKTFGPFGLDAHVFDNGVAGGMFCFLEYK